MQNMYKFYEEQNISRVVVTKKCWAEHFPALKGSPVCKSHLKRLKQHNPLQQNSYDDVSISIQQWILIFLKEWLFFNSFSRLSS